MRFQSLRITRSTVSAVIAVILAGVWVVYQYFPPGGFKAKKPPAADGSSWLGFFNPIEDDSLLKSLSEIAQSGYQMEAAQIYTLALMFALGFAITGLLKDKIKLTCLLLLSFPLGAAAWVLITLLFMIFRIPLKPLYLFGACGAIAVFLIAINIKRRILDAGDLIYTGVFFCCFLAVSAAAVIFNYSVLADDSWHYYATAGNLFVFYEKLNLALLGKITTTGVFMPASYLASIFFGAEYFYAFQPVLSVNFFILFFYLLYSELRKLNLSKWLSALWSMITLSALASTYFIIFQTFWIMPSLIAGIYFFISVYAISASILEDNDKWLIAAALSLLSFCLLRVEAPVFALTALIVYLSQKKVNKANLFSFYFPITGIMVLWTFTQFSLMPSHFKTSFSDPMKALLVIFVYAGFLIAALLTMLPFIDKFRKYLSGIMLYAFVLLTLYFVNTKVPLAVSNFKFLIVNLFASGGWDGLSYMFVLFGLAAVFMPAFRGESIYLVIIVTHLLMLFNIFFLRVEPLRMGFGDSANRMFTHIAPVMLFYLSYKFANRLRAE